MILESITVFLIIESSSRIIMLMMDEGNRYYKQWCAGGGGGLNPSPPPPVPRAHQPLFRGKFDQTNIELPPQAFPLGNLGTTLITKISLRTITEWKGFEVSQEVSVLVEESLRFEFLGLLPDEGTHAQILQAAGHNGSFGDIIPSDLGVPVRRMW